MRGPGDRLEAGAETPRKPPPHGRSKARSEPPEGLTPGWKRAFRIPRRAAEQAAADVAEEIRFHLEMRTEELIARGWAPAEARRIAEEEFGDTAEARRALRSLSARRERWSRLSAAVDAGRRDVGYAWRSLRGTPGFAVVTVATLALAIGANTAIFSVANAVLFRPLPYAEPDRITAVWEHDTDGSDRNHVTTATLLDWRAEQQSFAVFGPYSFPLGLALAGDGPPEEVQVTWMSPEAFRALGVPPVLGRAFTPEEGRAGAPDLAVLSWGFWQRRFGGDPAVLDRTITLDDTDYRIVGVMGPEFDFPHIGIDVWPNLDLPESSDGQNRRAHQWRVIARLRDGVSAERADAELDALSARLEAEYPQDMTGWRANVEPYRRSLTSGVRPLMLVLLAVVGIVLLIACANVANLFLTRHSGRSRQIAVRRALGAGRTRLVRQLFVESALIGGAGALVGLAVAAAGLKGFVALAPADIPLLEGTRIDRAVLGFTAGATLLGTLLFGLLPAFRFSRAEAGDALREGGGRTAGGRSQARLRVGILVGQVALSALLLVGAGLLIRSLERLQSVDYGFEPEGILAVTLRLPTARYQTVEEQSVFFRSVIERVSAIPGVRSVAGTTEPPVTGYQMTFSFAIEDRPPPGPDPMEEARDLRAVTPGYFETMGMRLVRGRVIEPTDHASAPLAAVVNEALAEVVWPGEDPIGQRISTEGPDGPWWEIVGIVNDMRHRSPEEALPAYYVSWAQRPWTWMSWLSLMVRAEGDPLRLVRPIEEAVWAVDDQLPLRQTSLVTAWYAESRARSRFATVLLAAFAGVALTLGAIGLYGVLSYSVGRRRQELGIRLALGAGQGRVTASVVQEGLRLAGVGIAVGMVGAFLLSRLLESLLYGVGARDPLTFVTIPLVLLAVAALSAWIPARRASRIEPVTVLRDV